jgi:hypothetical protein
MAHSITTLTITMTVSFMLGVAIKTIIPSVVMLSVVMLSVIMMSVILQSVVAPLFSSRANPPLLLREAIYELT